MATLTKRQKAFSTKVTPGRAYPVEEAVTILNDLASSTKLKESVDVAINLGVDPRKSDQVVRGATTLPHGTGKTIRIAVFAQGESADRARDAGADVVGFDDLADKVKAGQLDFDVVIATPDAMRLVGQLGRVLGPRGLMPNPKTGTVTPDVTTAVRNAKSGQIQFRTDKAGIIHGCIGKVGFSPVQIKENLEAVLNDLKKAKPASAKGIYLKKVTLSTTMGPGIPVDQTTLEA